MLPLYDFATWEPLLGLLRATHGETLVAPGGHVGGRIGRDFSSVPLPLPPRPPGRALQVEDMQEQFDAVERVQTALSAVDLDDIGFVMEMSSAGRVVLRLLTYGPAEKFGISGVYPGWLILVENSVPEPFRRGPHRDRQPAVAHVNNSRLKSVQAAAHPNLEVLGIGVWDGGPLSLAPVTELPRLRTLTAYSGTLANPLEIALLNRLEFLELGPEEWRVLLNAAAVPRSLLAAAIHVPRNLHPLSIVSLANELLSLWGRPPIVETIVQGHLGRGA